MPPFNLHLFDSLLDWLLAAVIYIQCDGNGILTSRLTDSAFLSERAKTLFCILYLHKHQLQCVSVAFHGLVMCRKKIATCQDKKKTVKQSSHRNAIPAPTGVAEL